MIARKPPPAPKYYDDRFADQSAMTDAELNAHIETLKGSAHQQRYGWGRDDVAVLTMLQIAVAEKNSRAPRPQAGGCIKHLGTGNAAPF